MNTVNKYYADPNISRRIISPDFVASALPNKFLMETKPAAPQRTQVIATPVAKTTVRATQTATPQAARNSNVETPKAAPAPANPYGDSCDISALKSGCATDSRGLDEALSSQNNCCSHDSCDSFSLSPQAMLFNVMQDMMMLRSSSAYGQAMNMMNGGMMPGGFNSPCMNSGMGFNSPMQMMNPGFGLNFHMNASWSFSSFSSFWGNGQF